MIIGNIFSQLREWSMLILTNIENSLVFAPMLCVTMIGVRLRAMQLKIRDPQPWAQHAMYTATFAIVTQVACTLLFWSVRGFEDGVLWGTKKPLPIDTALVNCNRSAMTGGSLAPAEVSLASKMFCLLLLFVHSVASAVCYVAIGVLVGAVFSMEPVSFFVI
jgi:hypothetical protein